jgi:AhpD family alkylhydroperoxidase
MSFDNKIKELIAIGASISANCQPCLEYHTGKAKEYGSDPEEISEAIEIGKLVRRGAASKMDKFAMTLNDKPQLKEIRENKECGCGK